MLSSSSPSTLQPAGPVDSAEAKELVAGYTIIQMNLTPVGHVESSLADPAAAPKQGTEGAPDAWLVFEPAFQDALADLRGGDDVVVLTWLDRADRGVLRVHPRDDVSRPLLGVFSTRSADRPNPIGLHRVQILEVAGLRLLVRGLEAVNGTPILDVKPWL
jgi:tRNA-Thr(GGU) m(6)t(6)A37 methyltransferase TsaA